MPLILPVSRWDVLEAKTRLGVNSLNECYYSFEAPADVPQAEAILRTMHQGLRFFDELNYFAYRMTEMSHSERILLNGAIAIHGPDSLKGLINLTWHTDNIVLGEVESDAELGRFLLENDMVSFPEEVIPYLDFAKIGQQHRADNSCAFDRHIYYEDLEPVIKEVYDGYSLPDASEQDTVFIIHIRNPAQEIHMKNIVNLALPASHDQIDDALRRLNLSSMEAAAVVNYQSNISAFVGMDELPERSLRDFNTLAETILNMDSGEYIKYLAALECEGLHIEFTPQQLLRVAQQLDEYDFNPAITAADIGSYGFIRHTGPVQEMAQIDTPQQTNEIEMGGF
ncbi:hypothetical protein LJC34_00335 [Oscillospiraceae bacterium OttesenSCG-928-G22]|nr:hypothetical protein [Oscillospiraceae bacterium OttesenSCG-928-G22]